MRSGLRSPASSGRTTALDRACAARPSSSPSGRRYAYVYAVALHSAGRRNEARSVLRESLARHPDDRDTLLALVTFSRDAGDIAAALDYAEQLARMTPGDVNLDALISNLRRQVN